MEQMNHEQAVDAMKGLGAIGAIQVINGIPTEVIMELAKVIIQGIVAVGTLWHLWKQRDKSTSKDN